ncbi:PLDc N-terminal domain-containing protein [Egicoccus sp. AB-alg2]|uniref:PLDc N-terminal domain-containing protein n=1 Tax=Egicoccus sp. AB-alg2 TaxID=3242693 RepID=UPI00359F123F
MWFGLVTLALFAFTFYCLLDVVLTDEREIRNLPKVVWALLVALVIGLGGLLWLYAGRPSRSGASPGGGPAASPGRDPGPGRGPRGPRPSGPAPTDGASGPRSAPRGPDDDPEFLRRLDERLRRRDDRDG